MFKVRFECAWIAPFVLVLAACSGNTDTGVTVVHDGADQAPLQGGSAELDECTTDADCDVNERCVLARDGAPRECVVPARATSFTSGTNEVPHYRMARDLTH